MVADQTLVLARYVLTITALQSQELSSEQLLGLAMAAEVSSQNWVKLTHILCSAL